MSPDRVPLGVLDLVPISSGGNAGDALRNAVHLAERAEDLGYRRYWFAEHHLNPGVAGSSPAVLIALVAAATQRIRLGSGGVQSGHRTALSVVEEFGLIDALHPGRLDLGLGRSGGRNFMRDRLAGLSTTSGEAEAAANAGGSPRPGRHCTDNGLLIPSAHPLVAWRAPPDLGSAPSCCSRPGPNQLTTGSSSATSSGCCMAPTARPKGSIRTPCLAAARG